MECSHALRHYSEPAAYHSRSKILGKVLSFASMTVTVCLCAQELLALCRGSEFDCKFGSSHGNDIKYTGACWGMLQPQAKTPKQIEHEERAQARQARAWILHAVTQ